MLFHQWVHSISPEQSPAEKQRGLHIKTGRKKKKKLMKEKKMCLFKSRRWHGSNEKEEVCCQNSCWGWSLPLLKGSVLGAAEWCWEWARFGPAFRQAVTQVPAGPRARAASLPRQRCRLAQWAVLQFRTSRSASLSGLRRWNSDPKYLCHESNLWTCCLNQPWALIGHKN